MPPTRQRMDFLLLLPHRRRVVIEPGGGHHYAGVQQRADPRRYAQMAAEDRALHLAGYQACRFGGHELANRQQAAAPPGGFFARLPDVALSGYTSVVIMPLCYSASQQVGSGGRVGDLALVSGPLSMPDDHRK